MQEHQVTAAGFTHKLPTPFFVLATQNPIEQEGTYPLPEAQLDRFMFKVLVDYPSEDEEFEIVRVTTAPQVSDVSRVMGAKEIIRLQDIVRRVPCAEHVLRYAMKFAPLDAGGARRSAALHCRLCGLGRRSAGVAEPGAGGQGAGHPARAFLRFDGGHPRGRAPRVAAPHHHEFQRRGGRA